MKTKIIEKKSGLCYDTPQMIFVELKSRKVLCSSVTFGGDTEGAGDDDNGSYDED